MLDPLVKKTRIKMGHKRMMTKRTKKAEHAIALAADPSHTPINLAKLTRLKLSLR